MSDTGDMTSAVEAAFAASSTPEPASTTATESTAASPTVTPTADVSQAAATSTETTTSEPGPVPYTRFKEVNEKYGTASKELEGLAWAKGVNPQLAQSAMQLLTRAQSNPLAFTEELEILRDHPQFGPQLRSWAARTLGMRTAPKAEPAAALTMPEPDLVFDDGRKAFSDAAMGKVVQFLQQQLESTLEQRLSPIASKAEANERFVAEQTYAAIQEKAKVDGRSEIESLAKQYPQFDEHRADVREVMEANPSYTLKQAWAEVFVTKVGPKLAGQSAAAVKQKVSAGSANPARPNGAATAQVPGSIREHLEQLLG